MKRRAFSWKDPATDTKHRLWTVRDFVTLFEKVIEIEEQAEDFFTRYSKLCANAESNVGYFISLIADEDIRQDALELFQVVIPEPENCIHQVFGPSEGQWASSIGFKVIEGKRWTVEGVKEYSK